MAGPSRSALAVLCALWIAAGATTPPPATQQQQQQQQYPPPPPPPPGGAAQEGQAGAGASAGPGAEREKEPKDPHVLTCRFCGAEMAHPLDMIYRPSPESPFPAFLADGAGAQPADPQSLSPEELWRRLVRPQRRRGRAEAVIELAALRRTT